MINELNCRRLKDLSWVSIGYDELKDSLIDTDEFYGTEFYKEFKEYDLLCKYNSAFDIKLNYISDNVKYFDKTTNEDKTYMYKELLQNLFNVFDINVKTRKEVIDFVMDKGNVYKKVYPIYIIELIDKGEEE
jgi:hypothetical protein